MSDTSVNIVRTRSSAVEDVELLEALKRSEGRDVWVQLDPRDRQLVVGLPTLFRAGVICCVGVRDASDSEPTVGKYVRSSIVILPWESRRFLDLTKVKVAPTTDLLSSISVTLNRLGFSTYVYPYSDQNSQFESLADYFLDELMSNGRLPSYDELQYMHVIRDQSISTQNRKLSLLIDLSHLRAGSYNGTMVYGREIYHGIRRNLANSCFGRLSVLGSRQALEFHGIPYDCIWEPNDLELYDVCFRPYQVEEGLEHLFNLYFLSKRLVITQLDAIGDRCNYINTNYRRVLEGLSLLVADGLVFISDYARQDIQSYYQLGDLEHSAVIHLGMSADEPIQHSTQLDQQTRSYLVVGNSKYDHKMIRPVLDVAKRLIGRAESDIRFIFLADLSGEGPLPREIEHSPNKLSPAELEQILAEASGVIYPSIYEGFGLPVVHAIRHSKKVLLADYPINRELANIFAGADLCYFTGIHDLEPAISAFTAHRDNEREGGVSRNWDEVAKETLDYLGSTVHGAQNFSKARQRTVEALFLAMHSESSNPQTAAKRVVSKRVGPTQRDNPRVSVILTSYNYEQFVAESVRSVLAQTYRNFELIIVDDGSTDGSRQVIEEEVRAASISVKLIFKENEGQASAFNSALGQASGGIVAFIDSDDIWYEEKLEKMVEFIGLCSDGAVYQHQLHTGEGLKAADLRSGDVFSEWVAIGNLNLYRHQGLISPFLPTTALMVRREILDKVLPIPEELGTCPDGYITRTTCAYGPLYTFPLALGLWRDHGGNAGLRPEYGYEEYWLPVLRPALNQFYADHGIPLRLVYHRTLGGRLSQFIRFLKYQVKQIPRRISRIRHHLREGTLRAALTRVIANTRRS